MATITDIIQTAPQSWQYTWSGTAPFDVWNEGDLILNQTTDTSLIVSGDDSEEPPALEVRDVADTEDAQNVQWPPGLTLQWHSEEADSVDLYLIQEWTGAAWVTRQIAIEEGRGYYRHTTRPQTDGEELLWRVVALDQVGNEGNARAFTVAEHVRNPDPPRIDSDYVKPNLVISARA